MLGDLEENFKSLEQGSKDMVAQARISIIILALVLKLRMPGETISCAEHYKVLVWIVRLPSNM